MCSVAITAAPAVMGDAPEEQLHPVATLHGEQDEPDEFTEWF